MKNKLTLLACLAYVVLIATPSLAQTAAPVAPSKQAELHTWQTYHPLSHGLTEKAIAASKNIKFIPAVKDGKYVSMWMQLEYNFNLF